MSFFDKLIAEDWRWIREEAERMRSEVDEEYFEAGESPMEVITTSQGYVELWSGFEDGEGRVVARGEGLPESEWPAPEEGDEEAE